jgi:hypothetical protein
MYYNEIILDMLVTMTYKILKWHLVIFMVNRFVDI